MSRIPVPAVVAVILVFLVGCSSLQEDIYVDTADELQFQELSEMEESLVALRLRVQENGGRPDSTASAELEALRKHGDNLALGKSLNRQYSARLEALRGLEAWISGDKRRAGRHLEAANQVWELDELSMLLEALLIEDDTAKLAFLEDRLTAVEGLLRLQSEQANVLFSMGRFGEAVAAWDSVLPKLPESYQMLFSDQREKAWALKNSDSGIGGQSVSLISDGPLPISGMVEVTRLESDLLTGIDDGRDVDKNRLFEFLVDAGYLLSPVQAEANTRRRDAAYFLWQLLVRKENDPAMVNRFSTRFAGRRSPVPDLEVNHPWFDAALGCVQTEVMSLPDGLNFYPNDLATGIEFIAWLEAVKAY